jgi:hypothetical protein
MSVGEKSTTEARRSEKIPPGAKAFHAKAPERQGRKENFAIPRCES